MMGFVPSSAAAPASGNRRVARPRMRPQVQNAVEIADVGRSLGMTSVVFFLTGWGMISFVKGSTKARIIQTSYTTNTKPQQLVQDAVAHFTSRAYKMNPEADKRPGVLTFEGLVSPSVTVAAILFGCAVASLTSMVIVARTYLPDQFASNLVWLTVLPSVFIVPWYWSGAERVEQVKMLVETEGSTQKMWLKGHRDELAVYEEALGMSRDKPEEE